MTRAGIAQRIAAVGGMPVLVAAAIAVAAWFLLAQADRARHSAVIAGTVYRELMGAAAARSDYLHAAPAKRAPQAALFDARTAEARRQLDALAALAGEGDLAAAVAANRRTLGGYAERMDQFKAVTEGNDALIATMARQAARLVEITDSARQRQRIANVRFSESIAESDRRLRLNRDVLDHARGLRNALAGLWRYEATRLAAVDEAATQLDINVLTARLQLSAKALDEAMDGVAGQPAHGQAASATPVPDSFAAVAADLGQALAARTPVQGWARALDGRIDQIINIHSTAYASVQDELTELTGHAVEANETEQEVQNIAVAVLKLTGRTADAVVQRDTAATTRILGDARVVAVGFDGPRRDALAGILRAGGVGAVAWVGYGDDPLARIAADSAEAAREGVPGVAVILHTAGTTDAAMACGKRIVEAGIQPAPKVMLTASRLLVSSLGEADRIGLFCTLTLPLRRQRLWQVLAAVLGRASLERRGGAQDDDASGWTPPSVEEAQAAGCLILVAEDNPINQTVIRRMLNQRGYALETADDGAKALAMHRPGRYGLLLTDFHMPEMDGFTLTRMLRQREEENGTGRLPIVALTADALPGTEQRCLEAGMDGYLTKPIDSRLLAAVLDRHLPQARALRRRARPTERLAAPSPTAGPVRTWRDADIDPAIFDLGQLAENFAPGDPDAVAFLERFLGMVPGLIETAADRLAAGDTATARDAVHTLKGASLSIGAARLGQLAADAQDCLDADDADTAALLVDLLAPTHEELVEATAVLREFTASMAPC